MHSSISIVSLYERNKGFLYHYNDSYATLVCCRSVRKAGYEERKDPLYVPNFTPKGQAGNSGKLSRSIRRTRSKIIELGICNTFDYFITLTFDQARVSDRYDIRILMKSLAKWINNYNTRRAGASVKYLLIPEKHKDGAWHLHGLVSGIPVTDLHSFSLSEHLPYRIRNELKKGHQVFQWVPYASKFGHCTLTEIRSREAVSKYITKYITKDLESSITEQNAHMYYCSKGLNRKELVLSGPILQDFVPDFESEYVKIKQSADIADLAQYFADVEVVEDENGCFYSSSGCYYAASPTGSGLGTGVQYPGNTGWPSGRGT